MKQYMVTGHNVASNTELKLEYEADSEKKEYDNLVGAQNIGEIELNVTLVDKDQE